VEILWFQKKKLFPLSIKFTHDFEGGCKILEVKLPLMSTVSKNSSCAWSVNVHWFVVLATASLVLWRSVESC